MAHTPPNRVHNCKLLASSKNEARSIIEEANFFILIFQITALLLTAQLFFFEEPSFIFEEAKLDLHNGSGPVIQVSFYYFYHKKKLAQKKKLAPSIIMKIK